MKTGVDTWPCGVSITPSLASQAGSLAMSLKSISLPAKIRFFYWPFKHACFNSRFL
jgi:hypothetical protein